MRLNDVSLFHPHLLEVTPSMNHSFPPDEEFSSRIHPHSLYSSPRNDRLGKRQLPVDFVPDSTSVICGRGKACTASPGNKRLKAIVESFIGKYSEATTKTEKTNTVNMIMDAVQGKDRDKGIFVRQHNGFWWEVEDAVAREKVGCLIRDCLHTQYRSSSKAKFLNKKRRSQMALTKGGDGLISVDQEADCCGPTTFGVNSVAMSSSLPEGLFTLSGLRQDQASSLTSTGTSQYSQKQKSLIHRVFESQNTMVISGSTDNDVGMQNNVIHSAASRMDDMAIMAFCSAVGIVPRPRDTLVGTQGTQSHNDLAKDFLTGIREETQLPDSESSPDSISWGVQGRGRGFLQQARDVVGHTGNSDSLPDDLSGIFDD